MFKMALFLYRRADLSPEQFLSYWRDVHGPLGLRFAPDLGIRRYVQLRVDAELASQRGLATSPDGVAELWWDSREAWRQAYESPAGQRARDALRRDELNFCDPARSVVAFGTEATLWPIEPSDGALG